MTKIFRCSVLIDQDLLLQPQNDQDLPLQLLKMIGIFRCSSKNDQDLPLQLLKMIGIFRCSSKNDQDLLLRL